MFGSYFFDAVEDGATAYNAYNKARENCAIFWDFPYYMKIKDGQNPQIYDPYYYYKFFSLGSSGSNNPQPDDPSVPPDGHIP